jgi:hypothetical protein
VLPDMLAFAFQTTAATIRKRFINRKDLPPLRGIS